MRYGQNPAKFIEQVPQPQKVTVAIVTYIPFLTGYYTQSLEVLKACLGSLWANTDLPFDLLVFDNASCAEVRDYLLDAQQQKRIQYLILSDKNLGKPGAWNVIFGGAPGEVVVYADSDIYFYPGWLKPQLEALEAAPNVGMVTGMPLRTPEEFSTATVAWAQANPEAQLERGQILSWENYWKHARSLGHSEEKARELYDNSQDVCVTLRGNRYYVGAGHFQFTARRDVLRRVLPIPAERPMGRVRLLDVAINAQGCLRLTTPEWWIRHMGNTVEESREKRDANSVKHPSTFHSHRSIPFTRLLNWKPVRKILLGLYGRIFDIYFRS